MRFNRSHFKVLKLPGSDRSVLSVRNCFVRDEKIPWPGVNWTEDWVVSHGGTTPQV